MATNGNDRKSPCLLVGLAGETAPGYEVHSGLYRLNPGNGDWHPAESGLPDAPEVRALTPHPSRPNTIYAGTQDGPYLSEGLRRLLDPGLWCRERPPRLVYPIRPQ